MSKDIKDSTEIVKRETYITRLSPEEKKLHYAKMAAGIRDNAVKKRKLLSDAAKEAQVLLPKLIAERIIEETVGENFNPSMETITKLRSFINSGISLTDMRRKFFSSVDQKTWDKLTRFMFKDAIPNTESLGIDIIKVQQTFIKSLESRKKDLLKEIKGLKKANRVIGPDYYRLLSGIEQKLYETQISFGEHLTNTLEVVGDKVKAATINLNFGTPRPAAKGAEEAIDVTPKTKLSDIL